MMKKFMKKLWEKKDSKKGFTLVELIVVLVILAILAAIMVPALLGWIDRAKEKQNLLEARTAYLAAQTLSSEEYAKPTPDRTKVDAGAVETLSGVSGTVTTITWKEMTTATSKDYYVVEKIVYTPTAGAAVTYPTP